MLAMYLEADRNAYNPKDAVSVEVLRPCSRSLGLFRLLYRMRTAVIGYRGQGSSRSAF
jgi:hypothetical protein